MTPSEQPDDLAELIDRHEVVTDVLRRHGCVLIGSSEDRKRFRQSLDSLGAISPDAKKLWETTFSFLKSRHRHLRLDPETAPPWDDVLEVEELAAWSGRTAVVALSPEQAALLGVEGSASSKLDENVELQIAKGCSLRSAQPFKRYASLERHGVIPHGYDRDHWFDEVLLPLVCEAREIYVVDRYLYNALVWDRRKDEHIAWLLRRFGDAGGEDKHVWLVGAIRQDKAPADVQKAAAFVKKAVPTLGPSIGELTIVGAPWRHGMPHDRHISFDLEVALEFLAGIDDFQQQTIRDEDGVSWKYCGTTTSYAKCRNERPGS